MVIKTETFINRFYVGSTNMAEKLVKKKEPEEIAGRVEEDNESILKENIRGFLKSAELVYKTSDFTSATILYFKALFSILDLIILRGRGKIPKDHSERFRILELDYNELYIILDKLYPDYRDTYTVKINKEICHKIKENVERVVKEQKFF